MLIVAAMVILYLRCLKILLLHTVYETFNDSFISILYTSLSLYSLFLYIFPSDFQLTAEYSASHAKDNTVDRGVYMYEVRAC